MSKMKTKHVNTAIDNVCQDFIGICPHCDAKVHLVMEHNDYHIARNGDQYNYITFRCKPCKKLSVRVFHSRQNPYSHEQMLEMEDWTGEFPAANTTPNEKFVEFAPEDVIADYTEGLICLANGANKAAVSMFRRAIQNAMLNLGADSKKNLIDQIRSVDSLTRDIQDWAQNIRIFGNWGAHPQEDNLKEVDHDLALEVKDFIDEFVNYVYVMPGKVSAARDKHVNKSKEREEEE